MKAPALLLGTLAMAAIQPAFAQTPAATQGMLNQPMFDNSWFGGG